MAERLSSSKWVVSIFTGITLIILLGVVVPPMMEQLPGKGTSTTHQLVNTAFTSNADNWENTTEGTNVVNGWNAGGYITISRTDNNAGYENGYFWQSVTLSSLGDKVNSATVSFKYRVIDNDNVTGITIKAILYNGTDNTTLFSVSTTENAAAWTSVENDIASLITSAGTYTLYLRAEENVDSTAPASSVIVGFDDANLSITTYSNAFGDDINTTAGNYGPTIVKILFIGFFLAGVFLLLRYLNVV